MLFLCCSVGVYLLVNVTWCAKEFEVLVSDQLIRSVRFLDRGGLLIFSRKCSTADWFRL